MDLGVYTYSYPLHGLLRDGGSGRRGRLDVEVLEDRVQLGVRVLGLGLEDLDLAEELFRALDLTRVAARLHALLELRDDLCHEVAGAEALGRDLRLGELKAMTAPETF